MHPSKIDFFSVLSGSATKKRRLENKIVSNLLSTPVQDLEFVSEEFMYPSKIDFISVLLGSITKKIRLGKS